MFKIVPNPLFKAVVALTVPGEEMPGTIEVEFRHKGRKELNEWRASAKDKTDTELLAEVITGWSGVEGGDGNQVTYSVDGLYALLNNYSTAATELYEGYWKALNASRIKN